MFKFFLGTHCPDWLSKTTIPLFISNRRLYKRKSFPRAKGSWALDSGGFSELNLFGKWETTAKDYNSLVIRYSDEIGNLEWSAIQDWMCEPFVLEKTGKSLKEHQQLTINSFLELKSLGPEINYIPILQGWEERDYLNHVEQYLNRGIDLTSYSTVGIGSVCRRQKTKEISQIIERISRLGIKLHGFGVKKQGLKNSFNYLHSADSMAWSFNARRASPLSQCDHTNCANCIIYAKKWFFEILEEINWSNDSIRFSKFDHKLINELA